MSQSDFQRQFSQEDRPLAAGSVRGVRAWKTPLRQERETTELHTWGSRLTSSAVTQQASAPTGILTGQYGGEWVPGENVAECKVDRGGWSLQYRIAGQWVTVMNSPYRAALPRDYGSVPSPNYRTIEETDDPCGELGPDCTCGFYGYWTMDAASIGSECNVVGVVEAYGKVTIGAKGFRAQKAKILALAPIVDRTGQADPALREAMELVAKRHPEAAIFPTVASMLAEFPTDEPPEIEEPEPEPDQVGSTGPHLHIQSRMSSYWSAGGYQPMPPMSPGGIIYSPTPPPNPRLGAIWYDTSELMDLEVEPPTRRERVRDWFADVRQPLWDDEGWGFRALIVVWLLSIVGMIFSFTMALVTTVGG